MTRFWYTLKKLNLLLIILLLMNADHLFHFFNKTGCCSTIGEIPFGTHHQLGALVINTNFRFFLIIGFNPIVVM